MCVCLCACVHSLAHLLFKAFQVFSGSSRKPQGGTALSCPAQLRGSRFLRWGVACGQQHFLPHPLLCVLPLLHTVLFFFFCQFLNFIWPCLDRGMSTSPRRIYKEEEPAGRNESGVRNHQQETSGAPLLVLGLNGFPVQKL